MGQTKLFELRVGERGRIVLPARIRKALQIHEGDPLVARLEGSSVRIASLADEVSSLKGTFARSAAGRDPVGELLAERRQEAVREEAPSRSSRPRRQTPPSKR